MFSNFNLFILRLKLILRLDPIFTMISNAPVKLTTVGFSPNSDVILVRIFDMLRLYYKVFLLFKSLVVGSSDGSICIYGIKNKPPRAAVLNYILIFLLMHVLKLYIDLGGRFGRDHKTFAHKSNGEFRNERR